MSTTSNQTKIDKTNGNVNNGNTNGVPLGPRPRYPMPLFPCNGGYGKSISMMALRLFLIVFMG